MSSAKAEDQHEAAPAVFRVSEGNGSPIGGEKEKVASVLVAPLVLRVYGQR